MQKLEQEAEVQEQRLGLVESVTSQEEHLPQLELLREQLRRVAAEVGPVLSP